MVTDSRPEALTTWQHDNGDRYVVVKTMKGKIPCTKPGPKPMEWVEGVEYTSLKKAGESFWRTLDDFLSNFKQVG